MGNKPGKRGKYHIEIHKEKNRLHSTQRSFRHRKTVHKKPGEFKQHQEPELDIQEFMQEILK